MQEKGKAPVQGDLLAALDTLTDLISERERQSGLLPEEEDDLELDAEEHLSASDDDLPFDVESVEFTQQAPFSTQGEEEPDLHELHFANRRDDEEDLEGLHFGPASGEQQLFEEETKERGASNFAPATGEVEAVLPATEHANPDLPTEAEIERLVDNLLERRLPEFRAAIRAEIMDELRQRYPHL